MATVASEAAASTDSKIAVACTELGSRIDAAMSAAQSAMVAGNSPPVSGEDQQADAASFVDVVRRSDEMQERVNGLQSLVTDLTRRHGTNVQSLSDSILQVQSRVHDVTELVCTLEASSKTTAVELNSDVVDLSERVLELEDSLGPATAAATERLASVEAAVAAAMQAAEDARNCVADGDIDSVLRDELALGQLRELVAALAERLRVLERLAVVATERPPPEGIPQRDGGAVREQ